MFNKTGKDMTRQEKIDFLSKYELPVSPYEMSDAQLSGAVNLVLIKNVMSTKP